MSTVNDQITDSVNQLNTLLTATAPMQSMGMLDVTATESIGIQMLNAVTAQQNSQTSASAAVTASCAKMIQQQSAPVKPSLDIEQIKDLSSLKRPSLIAEPLP